MLETTAAWLAALIDGEGSVMLSRRTFSGRTPSTVAKGSGVHYRAVVVVAATTDQRLTDAIRQKLDVGQVYRHRVGGSPQALRRRTQWTYRLNAGQIRLLLPPIRPWLVLKGEQADLLMEALAIKTELTPEKGRPWLGPKDRAALTARLDAIYDRIRALNTRGREVMPNVEQ